MNVPSSQIVTSHISYILKFHIDIKAIYGKGRLLVHVTFDDEPYDGQVVKMGTLCYIIGVTKAIRNKICKSFGDEIVVTIRER